MVQEYNVLALPEPPLPPIPQPPRPTRLAATASIRHHLVVSMVLVVLISIGATRSVAQGGPGVVIAVSETGKATVKVGDKEQTVPLPEAKVGDKVVCTAKDQEGTWECTVQK